MTIDILICTINEGIDKVPFVLMPPMEGVRYVICMQYTDEKALDKVPMKVMTRKDVKLYIHESKGLSRNRNFAFDWTEADITVIADDDNRYRPEYIEHIRNTYTKHPEAEIVCFAAESYDGMPMKKYPQQQMTYAEAVECGYYPTSMEMTMRTECIKKYGLRFNENFGLGSELLCAGEEDVFMKDAVDKGLNTIFVPEVIVQSDPITTGLKFLDNKKLQLTKGATFRYLYGRNNAIWRTAKEAAWWMLHKGANPIPIIINMMNGIRLKVKG